MNDTENFFKEKGILFGSREKKTLGIINSKGKFTNLGLLMSDQCPYTIKMAVYPENDKFEFKDSIEFLSLGGLVKGLTIEDIKLGSSSSRNPKLVSILHRLGLVEAYGSGIPRIFELYKISNKLPEIKVAPNSFLLKIPKFSLRQSYLTVINYLTKNSVATREDIEKILETKKVTTIAILNDMIKRKLIVKEGSARNVTYKLK